jgi:hypothetical protein
MLISMIKVNQGSFDHYITNSARYYGYNRTEFALINKYTLANGLTYGLKTPGNREKPYKITFDHHDLQTLLKAKQKKQNLSSTDDNDISSIGLELLKLRFHGLGGLSEDGLQVGDLDLRVVYRP